jgi:hypothetical protein
MTALKTARRPLGQHLARLTEPQQTFEAGSTVPPFGSMGNRELRMSPLKKTVITIETDTLLIIRRRSSIRAWCPGCGRESDFVSEGSVRCLPGANVNKLALGGAVEAVHRIAGENGGMLVCLDSALRRITKPNRPPPAPR